MAGTASGAAKATAARLAKLEAKRINRLRSVNSDAPNVANEEPTSDVEVAAPVSFNVAPSLPVVDPMASGNQAVSAALPFAGEVVQRILSGRMRAPVAVRANVALRIIEMHHDAQKKGADPEAAAGLALLASLRARAAAAVPVEVIAREETVIPASRVHSQQQPDRQSDSGAVEPSPAKPASE